MIGCFVSLLHYRLVPIMPRCEGFKEPARRRHLMCGEFNHCVTVCKCIKPSHEIEKEEVVTRYGRLGIKASSRWMNLGPGPPGPAKRAWPRRAGLAPPSGPGPAERASPASRPPRAATLMGTENRACHFNCIGVIRA